MHRRPTLLLATLLACAPLLPAQHASDSIAPRPVNDPQAARVPIHTQPDERDGPAWAAGPDYKVRFDAGMTFFPVLGEAYPENLPFGWQTRSVTIGGAPLGDPTGTRMPSHDAWRYELRQPGIVERYDVRVDGVEQSFVIAERPATSGDLEVVGDVTTSLRAAPTAFAHREIAFRDAAGQPIVGYGRAFAFDAVGRQLPLETAFDGAAIRIRVPAAFVATAAFPLTIDPLTQRYTIPGVGAPGNGLVSYPSIARDDGTNRVIVSYARASSGSDYDLWVRRATDDFSDSAELIYTDLSASRSSRRSSAASVYGQSQIIAVEAVTSTVSVVRLYFHDPSSTQLNSGSIVVVPRPGSAWSDTHPSLGSARYGDHAYLAFQRDDGSLNTSASRIRGVLVDASNRSLGPIRDLRTTLASGYDAENPSVTASTRGDGWAIAWSEKLTSINGDDWDVFVQRVDRDGLVGTEIAPSASLPTALDAVSPQIGGLGGHYLVAYLARTNTGGAHLGNGHTLYTQTIEWDEGQSGSAQPRWQLASSQSEDLTFGETNRPIDHDSDTWSHWALAWRESSTQRLRIARLGYRGRATETVTIGQDGPNSQVYSPSVCFDDDGFAFQVVYASSDAALYYPVYGRRFERVDTAATSTYGGSCAGQMSFYALSATNKPFAGTRHVRIDVDGSRPNAPTWLLASIAPGVTPIPGSPACTLLLSTLVPPIDVVFGMTNGSGAKYTWIALPEEAGNIDLYWQYAQLDAGQIWTSNGLKMEIR